MEHNLCVLIDFENLAAGVEKEGMGRFDIRAVLRRLTDKGRILVSRSYGDWGRFARFKQDLLEAGVSMMELTSYKGQEKNRADIALVVDAMELAFTRSYIDTFVLLSGDSDFTPLVMRLKELNRRVIGIGTRGSTSRLLVECCDEFIFYDSLRKGAFPAMRPQEPAWHAPPPAQPAPVEPPRHVEVEEPEVEERAAPQAARSAVPTREEAFSLAVESLQGLLKDDAGPVLGGLLKQTMQRKAPAFDETEYGYAGFARFLEAARDKGLLALRRNEKAGGYQVDLPSPSAPREAVEDAQVEESSPPSEDSGAQGESGEEEAELPVLVGEAGRLCSVLVSCGYHPTTHFIRHTVVHELIDHVQERQARKKRNTLMYVVGDIARRCRKTEPMVPQRMVRTILNALKSAGAFKHGDGKPVRSLTAHFQLTHEPEELLETLRRFYFGLLLSKEESLQDSTALSELLWGDLNHRVEVEETLAWMLHDQSLSPGELIAEVPHPEPASERQAEPIALESGPLEPPPEVAVTAPEEAPAVEEAPAPAKRAPRRGRRRNTAQAESGGAEAAPSEDKASAE